MVLLVSCYLYRKRSNTNNVNVEAKVQGTDIQTPVDDFDIFIEIEKRVSFALILVGAPLKESLARAKLPVG